MEQTPEGWSLVPVSGDRPSGRNFAGVAVDDAGTVVLHGGLGVEGVSDETWLWSGDGWTQVPGGDGPGPRSSASMARDGASGAILLYGGDDGSEQYADTWAFADGAWTQVATDGPEPVRWPATMATDPRGVVVLVGGHQVVDEDVPDAVGDTWVWRRGRWSRVAGAHAPGPLVNAASVLHPDHGLLLVGGGDDRGRERGRVWQWSGSGWGTPSVGPLPAPPGVRPRLRPRSGRGGAHRRARRARQHGPAPGHVGVVGGPRLTRHPGRVVPVVGH